eukprot:CAMPEP_0170477058 /NCGR_PEP_ID=MMETSP0123-20130129/18375_1 /TAXON_ID=182087 /ORGANISM="Favella ehrenbergii, Strain Fehren 1" /LENGTH=120 /DNA_ID=CAMNT_0010748521 /DNA_START=1222 /DNA_END=1581 /DNA_ORIENTATION=+
MGAKVTEFDTCSPAFYRGSKLETQWENTVDAILAETLLEQTGGAFKYDFIKNWPSGRVSFDSAEWLAHMHSGVVTPADEADISAKIHALSRMLAFGGGQCPRLAYADLATYPLKFYIIIV